MMRRRKRRSALAVLLETEDVEDVLRMTGVGAAEWTGREPYMAFVWMEAGSPLWDSKTARVETMLIATAMAATGPLTCRFQRDVWVFVFMFIL